MISWGKDDFLPQIPRVNLFSLFFKINTMAFEAVSTSVTAFLPLGIIAGSWVLDARSAVKFTPSMVALVLAWMGLVALGTVRTVIGAPLDVTGFWAAIVVTVEQTVQVVVGLVRAVSRLAAFDPRLGIIVL